jgi:hypothetical protein
MNYYPNYNPSSYYTANYPYIMSNNLPYTQNVQSQITSPQTSLLNGKIVDSEDIVKVTDVPIGSYGIFPKADFSEIYIKSWNNNGTTNIITFKPDTTQNVSLMSETSNIINDDSINLILERITQLENKIDNVIQAPAHQQEQVKLIEQSKKEVKANAY